VLWVVVYFISGQITSMADQLPAIKQSLLQQFQHFQLWASQKLNISFAKQQQMIENAKDSTFNTLAPGTFNLLTASIATTVLIPVYIFLFLFYRDHFLLFLTDLFRSENKERVIACISDVKNVVHHFITGVLFETSIVATLNVIGLLIIGAPYAILLGIVGALMNTIPWIGGIIQLILSALIVFANTGSTAKLIATVCTLLAVQMIDNYFLVPRIIGSRVSLNALMSIIGVLVGGAVAGIGGMFLSIPFLAMLKIIFEQSEALRPWSILLGGDKDVKKKKR
jgi:predicted PurR-regulated permease PerM